MEEEIVEVKHKGSFIRKLFFVIILLAGLVGIYARYIGTTGLKLKEYSIVNSNIPTNYSGFKIVQFSDIHYGRTVGLRELTNLVNKINLSKPDIIIFTGDLIDKDYSFNDEDITHITNELSKLEADYGKFYVTGDHDLTTNYDNIMQGAQFFSLNDKYEFIVNKKNESIMLAGINYKSTGDYLSELFKNELPSYKILVMHTPDTYDAVKQFNFNLVLAGHSHNGQINIPFIGALYKPLDAKNYYKEYYKIGKTDFYISSGIGTEKFNFRIFNRPSFNIYRLKTKIES